MVFFWATGIFLFSGSVCLVLTNYIRRNHRDEKEEWPEESCSDCAEAPSAGHEGIQVTDSGRCKAEEETEASDEVGSTPV